MKGKSTSNNTAEKSVKGGRGQVIKKAPISSKTAKPSPANKSKRDR